MLLHKWPLKKKKSEMYSSCYSFLSLNCVFLYIIQVHEKKSYALNSVVWVRQGGLQSDIQKILRHARKLPDKTQSFYKVNNSGEEGRKVV